MSKKGMGWLLWVLIVVVILILVFFGGYLVYHYFFDDMVVGEDAPAERKDSEAPAEVDDGPDSGEGGRELEGGDGGDVGGGGGVEEGSEAGSEDEIEQETLQEFVEPSASFELLDFDYEIVEDDLVKITSIEYTVYNLNIASIGLDILLYLYDDEDDDSQKGFVRDQVRVGMLQYGEDITETSEVSAYYRGNLDTEKVFKVTLIGYLFDQSYNLGHISDEYLFE